jgi:hypothetical protein
MLRRVALVRNTRRNIPVTAPKTSNRTSYLILIWKITNFEFWISLPNVIASNLFWCAPEYMTLHLWGGDVEKPVPPDRNLYLKLDVVRFVKQNL